MNSCEIINSNPSLNKYSVVRPIGFGAFGEVMLAEENDNGFLEVAIKIVETKSLGTNALESIEKERLVLEKCKGSPFIVEIK